MTELVFILMDFFPAADADVDPDAGAGLPALPRLETLFARAQCSSLQSGWRGWLAARAPGAPPVDGDRAHWALRVFNRSGLGHCTFLSRYGEH